MIVSTMKQRRGTRAKAIADLVQAGQIVIATDTQEMYFGNGAEGTTSAPVPVKVSTANLIGQIDESQLPASVRQILGGWTMKGSWDGATGNIVSLNGAVDGFAVASPLPAAAPENNGYLFLVSNTGNSTVDGYSDWNEGDFIVSDGSKWRPIENATNADIDGGVIS